MAQPLEITGSHDLRWSLVLSTLSGRSFRLSNVKPEINSLHANLLKFFHAFCTGIKVDVKPPHALTYSPGTLIGGTFSFETAPTRGVSYYLDILCCLATFARDPLTVTLFGNTNGAPHDIDVDRFRLCALPFLANFGITASVAVIKRGCYPGGKGTVIFKAAPMRVLRAVSIVDEGHVRRIRGVAYGCGVHADLPQRAATVAKGLLLHLLPDIEISTDVVVAKDAGPTRSFGLVLVAESTTKTRHSAEAAAASPEAAEEPPTQDPQTASGGSNSYGGRGGDRYGGYGGGRGGRGGYGGGYGGDRSRSGDRYGGGYADRRGRVGEDDEGDDGYGGSRGRSAGADGRGGSDAVTIPRKDKGNVSGVKGVAEDVAACAVDALLTNVAVGGIVDSAFVPMAAVILSTCPDQPVAVVAPPLDGAAARACALVRQFLGVAFVTHDYAAPKARADVAAASVAAAKGKVKSEDAVPARVLLACVGSGLINTTMRGQ